jgi:hypothetical protein
MVRVLKAPGHTAVDVPRNYFFRASQRLTTRYKLPPFQARKQQWLVKENFQCYIKQP